MALVWPPAYRTHQLRLAVSITHIPVPGLGASSEIRRYGGGGHPINCLVSSISRLISPETFELCLMLAVGFPGIPGTIGAHVRVSGSMFPFFSATNSQKR